MEDGIFPHSRTLGEKDEIEEERRLAYVGLTRARQRLYISRAEYRSTWGAPNYNPPWLVITTQRTPKSPAASLRLLANPAYMARVIAFILSGRLKEISSV